MKTKTYFAFRIDIWDATGNSIVEHVAGLDDHGMAVAAYFALLSLGIFCLASVWPQFRACIYWQFETPPLGKIALCCHLRNQANETRGRFRYFEIVPTASEEEEHDTDLIQQGTLMRSRANVQISCQYGPPTALVERLDPFHIRCVGIEPIAQSDDMVLVLK
jgi:hypothetical protein